jgi:uncharacterized RDD family membrane protein YckC
MAALTADTLQAVELADGVEIHLRVAGPAPRSAAWVLDVLILIGIYFAMMIVLGLTAGSLGVENVLRGIALLLLFVLEWFYRVAFEIGKRGATPGQRAVGLKVVSVSGGPVRLPQSIVRNVLRFVDFLPFCYLFGFICCLFTKRFQRLGDLVADTVVIYADPPARPPGADVRVTPVAPPVALSREEQSAIVDFLDRAAYWSDARRIELSDLLTPLTETSGMKGLVKVCGIGLWIQQGNKSSAQRSTNLVG